MSRSRDCDPDELAGPASGLRDRTVADLYAEHAPYVLALLPTYGIPKQDAEDVAQTVWLHVHRRRDSFDAATHKTQRAWISGFVRRCAANHHRTQRNRGWTAMEDPADLPAVGLNPEQAALLRALFRLVPNEDQRVALLLQVRHGLSIAEIAAAQEATESAVEWRLHMARKALKSDDDEEKSRAFLGLGSIEALAEALKPRPIPPEVVERQWQQIAERIRQEEAAPRDAEPPLSSSPPVQALPALPAPALPSPALASPAGPLLVATGKVKLAVLLVAAFVSGSGAGMSAVLAWLSVDAPRHGRTAAMTEASASPASATSASPSSAVSSSPSTARPRGTLSLSAGSRASATTAATAAPASPTEGESESNEGGSPSNEGGSPSNEGGSPSNEGGSPSNEGGSPSNEGGSQRLLARMREAMRGGQLSEVLALAEQHAGRFGALHVRQRETLRIEALRQAGQPAEAEERARTVLAAHPGHRRALERAAGRDLP